MRIALLCQESAGARILEILAKGAHELAAVLTSEGSPPWNLAARLGLSPLPARRVPVRAPSLCSTCTPSTADRCNHCRRECPDGRLAASRRSGRPRRAVGAAVAEPAVKKIPKVAVALPSGTMYAFFRIEGVEDSLAFRKGLVREVGLGLAPGSAFGPQGEGFVRWCFAASEEKLADGVARLRRALKP